MASLREIRRKIKSVKSTQQITKAMKMVAAARLRRAQARIISARPFAQKMESLMGDLLARVEQDKPHKLFTARSEPRRALLLVTADKGLCGAFNTNLIRETLKYQRQHGVGNVDLFVVGRKGRDYFRRMQASMPKEYVQIFNNLNFAHAEIISGDLIGVFLSQPYGVIDMLYNEFKSVIQQKVVVKQLLPLVGSASKVEQWRGDPLSVGATSSTSAKQERWPDYIYEPGKREILESIIPRFIKAQVFRVLLESAAAELGARMSAMENASSNARELIESLSLTMNRTRQSAITKEILEVVSGAEALK